MLHEHVIMIELNCPIVRSLNAGAGLRGRYYRIDRRRYSRDGDECTRNAIFSDSKSRARERERERESERARARAMRATGNLLSIKCIQQRNSG